MNIDKDILSASEFAQYAGVHYNTVRKMIKNGRITSFKIGCGGKTSNIRIPKSELTRLFEIDLKDYVEDLVQKRIEEEKTNVKYRFCSKIEIKNGCWIWKGARSASGYGVFSYQCKYIRAHRASWIIYRGDIPKDVLVLHDCDVRDCVNPDHLHLGTPKDNMFEKVKRNRCKAPKGENHIFCKLSDKDVESIINLRKNKVTARDISKKFNISMQYVYEISWGLYRNKGIKYRKVEESMKDIYSSGSNSTPSNQSK